ncbi:hypothetical protein BJ165DRAFT_1488555 [Panaeolus papilionaceus]|nr:hypothetical protein BJ165DRAFT_1488555 [Panaeolus papilionaceus]
MLNKISNESHTDDQPGPILPLEIFSHILDIMVESGRRMSDQPLTKEQSRDLGLCSLICKQFYRLTRPHFFRFVEVSLHGNNKFIGQLVQLLESYPDLKMHIRGICISTTTNMMEGGISETDIATYNRTLLHLPRLEAITVRHKPAQAVLFAQTFPPSDMQAFTNHLIETYSLRGMLRIFNAARVDVLPLSALTTCPSLRTVRLHRFDDPKAIANDCSVSSAITDLSLSQMEVPLSLFLRFPSLKKLHISYVIFLDYITDPGALTPPFGLRDLRIETDHEDIGEHLSRFLAYIHACAIFHQAKPFSALERLALQLDYPQRNLSVVSTFFEQLESLQALEISARMPWGFNGLEWSLVRNVNIAGHMQTSFKFLKSLSFKISSPLRSSSYLLPNNDLSHCFLSIPTNNYLEHITLDIPIDLALESESDDFDRRPWSCLVKILTAHSHFPLLQTFRLAIDFRFVIPGVTNLRLSDSLDPESHWIVTPCLDAMRNAIEELGRRSNLTLNPYFRPHIPSPHCLGFRCTVLTRKLGIDSSIIGEH